MKYYKTILMLFGFSFPCYSVENQNVWKVEEHGKIETMILEVNPGINSITVIKGYWKRHRFGQDWVSEGKPFSIGYVYPIAQVVGQRIHITSVTIGQRVEITRPVNLMNDPMRAPSYMLVSPQSGFILPSDADMLRSDSTLAERLYMLLRGN